MKEPVIAEHQPNPVVVERARFERLREYVAADRAYIEAAGLFAANELDPWSSRKQRALDALIPTDTDPLPDH